MKSKEFINLNHAAIEKLSNDKHRKEFRKKDKYQNEKSTVEILSNKIKNKQQPNQYP